MSSDKRLCERYVEAYLHDARPMSVILKELGVSKATAKVWRQAEGLSRGQRQRSLTENKFKDQYQKVVALVESGQSAHSALKETGFPQTAYRYLAQDGIELANTSRGGAIQRERDRIAKALKLVDAGKSYKQAGQVVDRCGARPPESGHIGGWLCCCGQYSRSLGFKDIRSYEIAPGVPPARVVAHAPP